ncbi:hypothetical protein Tco_0863120 [Tanacetum coccineum]
MLKLRHLYPKELLMHWKKLKQTEPVEMVMTAMTRELVAGGQSEMLASAPTLTSSNVNPRISRLPKELLVLLSGSKRWNLTVGHDVAYAMTWKTLKKMMSNKYCLRGEIKKLEIKLWNLKVKESDEVEKYVGGLPDMIQGSVMQDAIKTLQGTIKTSISLSKGIMWHGPILQCLGKRNHTEDLNFCALNETTIIMDIMLPSAPTARGLTISPGTGHFKSNCSNLKNKNQGNQAGNGNVVARAYAVGTAGTNPNSNVVTDHGYEIGSFDVIIGMDWLSKYHDVIFYDEKIVSIPFGDEILIVHGNGSNNEHGSRLNIILCTKTQKYLLKGCHVLLAHVTAKKAED